ncbi:MAG: FAD-binding monooxygenase [Sphingobacteriales bacterium]|nr:MAG: FAD-binding monooxygenase [Sphingobacteriales bacterium]
MKALKDKRVLISGASFAGLSTAYWMKELGCKVTVVETAPVLKKGGTPVNIMGKTIDIVKRMGIFDKIKANRITMETMELKNADDITEQTHFIQKDKEQSGEEEYEIERDVLLNIIYGTVKNDVEFIFADGVTALEDDGDTINVSFKKGEKRSFDLVFGCDGIHSAVRKYWFGEESEFSNFLQTYFSITIVDKLLIKENTTQMYNEPGKMVMLNAYNNKTDIVLCFFSEKEIDYDYRNEAIQRNMILSQFAEVGWRMPELLNEVNNSKTFYFDKLCQMKMPSWSKGRIALVGDAAYCASPAAGRGGSLAIDGAAALGDAFEKCNGDYEQAFMKYDKKFRPFIEQVQAEAVEFGMQMLMPSTEEAIRKRNTEGF